MRDLLKLTSVLAWVALAMAAAPVRADDPNAPDEAKSRFAAPDIGKDLLPSLVRVEITTHYDGSDYPRGGAGWPGTHNDVAYWELVREQRPAEIPGWLIAPDKVICGDMMVHPRFLSGFKVRQGSQLVDATPIAFGVKQEAMVLQLAKPIEGAKPVQFIEGGGKGPYTGFTFNQDETDFVIHAHPIPATPDTTETGERWLNIYFPCLIVNAAGHCVGMSFNELIPDDDAWKVPPAKWEMLTVEQHADLVDRATRVATRRTLAVTLNLRSPSASPQDFARNDPEPTLIHAMGVVLDARTILVLSELKPKTTSRLERIQVQPGQGPAIGATFAASLRDYGALVARLETPLDLGDASEPLLSDADLRPLRERLLPAAEILIEGETRVARIDHRRICSYAVSWRRHIYPVLRGTTDNLFLFSDAGALLALPISKRADVSDRQQNGQSGPMLTSAADVRAALADLKANSDPANVPLDEASQNRLAWLGVELQPMNVELAETSKVSELTAGGTSGAMVTYVYADSPAAKAGIEAGVVLLRLDVPGEAKPVDVRVEQYAYEDHPFPWDRLDQVPQQYFDRIPPPWPAVENSFTRALTDLGIGKKFTLEYAVNGVVSKKEFDVAESPTHYASAPRYKNDALGMTVRDVTFEVRRYMQCAPTDPCVIISKLEAGSKAAVAGLRPYELITHVNDQPVKDTADFQRLVTGQQELRFSVKRMTHGRIVKLQLPATEPPTTQKDVR